MTPVTNRLRRFLLPLLFAAACVCALWVTFWMPSRTATPVSEACCCCCDSKRDRGESTSIAVRWRVPFAARPAPPCAAGEGWIVADEAGGVTALGRDGAVRWRTAFSNQVFEAAAAVSDGIVVVASRKGDVIALRLEDGHTVWTRTTEGFFLRAPRVGVVNEEPAVWLVSQADGQLFCLRVRDGTVIWSGEPTNRCDGEPVMWQGRIAYGNCDGAVYLFDAATGAARGKIEVGADDQMAGGLLALPDGRLVGGTRQGHLVAVDPVALKLVARTVVAQSEAFATPVMTSDGEIATGTPEGEVVFCRLDGDALQVTGRVTLGTSEAGELVSTDDGIFALCGGELCVVAPEQRTVKCIALGDDAYGLTIGARGAIVCVADQSLVCVEGGGR
jgi:outer membrane protein assembly factor BamB